MPGPPAPIAIVLTSFDPGGTERQMTELISRLDRSRFEIHVACFRREGLWLPRIQEAAASVAEFPLRSFMAPSTAGRAIEFAAWCRRRRIALVQACDFYANVFALPAAALARVPIRIGSRRDILLPERSAGQHRLQRHAYRWAHRVVANSTAAARQVVAEGVPESRVTVVPNGIDLSRYRPRPIGNSSFVVTTVANLRSEKGHDVLIAAAAEVVRTAPSARFQLVGDGPMRKTLEAQVRALELDRHVAFLGHREDVPELLTASDVFVLPSRTEAFPNGLLEAMAAGVPSVASNVGGIPELVQDGVNGLLVPAGDAQSLARAILTLHDDGATAAAIGQRARATIEARYSFERMVSAFEELYLNALSGIPLPFRALYVR